MHYNLLYYGKNTGFCNTSNNSLEDKQSHLKEILSYVRPDILTVNELDGNASEPLEDDATHLLDQTLNVNGVDHYRKVPFQTTYLANTLFYNANKLKMYSWQSIPFHIGDHEKIFNAYTFYHNSNHLTQVTDTTFVTCFVIHLKSGNSDENAIQRAAEAEILKDFIYNEMPDSGNYVICGDLNVYGNEEEAFQILTESGSAKSGFYDPAKQAGNWHDSRKYKLYHTQSTHIGGDCFAGGGMDDRFDFILLSATIMDGAKGIGYIYDSYETLGQDGEGFNSTLNLAENKIVPEEIARALYHFSDHLPVMLKLRIDEDPAIQTSIDSIYHRPANPVRRDSVWVYAQLTDTEEQISSVNLLWGIESKSYISQAEMKLSGNFYFSGLKGAEETSKIYYKVNAVDYSGNVVQTSGERQIVFSEDTTMQINGIKNADFKISNPVKDQVDLYFNKNQSYDLIVTIVDATGKVRFRKSYPGFYGKKLTIPVFFIQPGVYWINIKCKSMVKNNMFIKQ